VEEINRGSSQLIEDYEEVINKVEMPLNIKQDLIFQKGIIENEVEELNILKKEFNTVTV